MTGRSTRRLNEVIFCPRISYVCALMLSRGHIKRLVVATVVAATSCRRY